MRDLDAIAARIADKTYTPGDLQLLLGELYRLRSVLGWYASAQSWEWQPSPSGGWSGRLAVEDGGARARAALAGDTAEV